MAVQYTATVRPWMKKAMHIVQNHRIAPMTEPFSDESQRTDRWRKIASSENGASQCSRFGNDAECVGSPFIPWVIINGTCEDDADPPAATSPARRQEKVTVISILLGSLVMPDITPLSHSRINRPWANDVWKLPARSALYPFQSRK